MCRRFWNILLLFLLAGCSLETPTAPSQTSPLPTATPTPAATPTFSTSTEAPSTPTSLPSATPTDISPQHVEFPNQMSNDVEGWYLYRNENGRYRFSFPPAAHVTAFTDNCVSVSLYGAGYIQIYPDNLSDNSPCQPTSIDSYEAVAQTKMIAINQQNVLIDGIELREGERYRGEIFRLPLMNGFALAYGISPETAVQEAPDVIRAVLEEMIASLRLSEVILAEVTPTPIPLFCPTSPPTPVAAEGLLRVTFQRGERTWLWREETGEAEVIATPDGTPPVAPDEAISGIGSNGRVAYLMQLDPFSYELWIADWDGKNARLLTTIAAPNISQHFEWATDTAVLIDWVGDSHLIRYMLFPISSGIGESPIEEVGIVDANSGERRDLLRQVDDLYKVVKTPDNRFLVALLPDEVRFVEINTGEITTLSLPQTIYADDNPIIFSPDQQKLVLFADEHVAVIDLDTLQLHLIPLPYVVIDVGYERVFPDVYWHDNRTFTTIISDMPQSDFDFNAIFSSDASFSVWQVNISSITAEKRSSFHGNLFMTSLAPNGRYLIYMHQDANNERQLYLADTETGEFGLYDQGRLIQLRGWSPDSSRFIYQKSVEQPTLGQFCQPPYLLTELSRRGDHLIRWVDSGRFLYFEGSPETNESNTIFLMGLDGTKTAVSTLDTAFAQFDFYFEDGR